MNQEEWNKIQEKKALREKVVLATEETFYINARYFADHLSKDQFIDYLMDKELRKIFKTGYELGLQHGLDPI